MKNNDCYMTADSHHFKLGATQYQIDFEGNQIRFYHVGKNTHRVIGTASFVIHGKLGKQTAQFNASIYHPSARVVEELGEIAEGIFREKHPGVFIQGHRTWFRRGKPPLSRSHSDAPPAIPKRKSGKPPIHRGAIRRRR